MKDEDQTKHEAIDSYQNILLKFNTSQTSSGFIFILYFIFLFFYFYLFIKQIMKKIQISK